MRRTRRLVRFGGHRDVSGETRKVHPEGDGDKSGKDAFGVSGTPKTSFPGTATSGAGQPFAVAAVWNGWVFGWNT
ncbi:hypothetical protein GCM10023192_29410 [Amycolatopsis samaneae]